MKTKIVAGFLIALAMGSAPLRAEDNPDQAAAREALDKKLSELDRAQTPSASGWDTGAVTAGVAKGTNLPVQLGAANTTASPASSSAMLVVPAPAKLQLPVTTNAPAVRIKPVPAPVAPAAPPVLAVARPRTNLTVIGTTTPRAAPKSPSAQDLTTTTGATYKNAQVERVETNGWIISYQPPGGGLALTKVYFEDLSAEVRQRFGRK